MKEENEDNTFKHLDKSNFVVRMLDYSIKHNVDDKTKERLINLIGKEIGKTGNISDEILKRLEKVENAIYKNKSINTVTESNFIKPKNNNIKQKIHNPKKILEWLIIFTINNTAIKFSTHLWDQNDLFNDYASFISQLNNEFQKYSFIEMANYNSNLYWEKVYPFLFQKELTSIQGDSKKPFGWGKHKIKVGWQYPSILKKWTDINTGKLPFSMELPDEIKPTKTINGKTIKYFEDIVNLFKKEIEFRDNDLYIEIKVLLSNILPNHKINYKTLESLKGLNFYTNTEYVIKAIERILKMIKSRSASIEVEIKGSYDVNNKEYIVEILHLKSFSDKPINDPKITQSKSSGDLSILNTTLMSLCDFSLESRFKNENNENEFYRVDYLYNGVDHNKWMPRIKVIEDTPGFKYILKFPTI